MRTALQPARREHVPHDAASSITFRDVIAPSLSYPWHYHPEVELMLVVRGRGLRYVGDSISNFEEGDLCLVGESTPHCWLSESTAGESIRALVVQFPSEVFGEALPLVPALAPVRSLLERAKLGLWVRDATRDRVAEELWKMQSAPSGGLRRFVRLLDVLALLAESQDTTPLSLANPQLPGSSRDATRSARLLRFIHEHALETLTQKDAARVAGLSPAAFSRFFSSHFGKPFVQYLAEVRVGHACRLLLESDVKVSEVAFAAGFGNLSSFNRAFVRLKGITPTDYRRMALATGRA